MTGLKRHTVRIAEHDPAWACLFGRQSQAIRHAGGDLILDVQHVGSTAVPGLPAKPIVDIAVAVPARDAIPALVGRLTSTGYIDRGDGGRDGGYLLVRESEPDVRTVHLHIVERSDVQWRNYLRFRDTLRQNAAVRERYAELKRHLALEFRNDRKAYTNAKNDFIRKVLETPGEVHQRSQPDDGR